MCHGLFAQVLRGGGVTGGLHEDGAVWVNTWNVFDAALPFGGYEESGWGREMGHALFDNYMETKTVITDLSCVG